MFLLCLLSLGQLWALGVLLLARQTETLLLFVMAAAGCWLWWAWTSRVRKQRALCALAVLNLVLALTAGMLCLWDIWGVPRIPSMEKIL